MFRQNFQMRIQIPNELMEKLEGKHFSIKLQLLQRILKFKTKKKKGFE